MKNSKKLTKSELKGINGGNAPECPVGSIACYHRPQNGIPSYWTCELSSVGCKS
ncbi:bacteriocin-like protein [Chryseobacterium paludis]